MTTYQEFIKSKINIVEWFGCYANGWGKGDIVPDAFAHPAKFSKQLIRRIYDHLLTEGYVRAGDVIADPFGGVALGAFWAMRNGLHWRGCELEGWMIPIGQGNIDLWNGRYADHFPGWGTAVLLQGDSRRLAEVLGGTGCVVSSPPYAQNGLHGNPSANDERYFRGRKLEHGLADYGSTPGQLGSMREGDYTAVISSPPYATDTVHGRNGIDLDKTQRPGKNSQAAVMDGYGRTDGNLGHLPPGTPPAAIVSSPPYSDAISGNGEGPGARHDFTHHSPDNATKKSSANGYGLTEGNLGNLAAVVSSPPYEAAISSKGHGLDLSKSSVSHDRTKHVNRSLDGLGADYGQTPGNLGNDTAETFWTAAQIIVAQCYQILAPGGVAVWVTGDFVRDGKRVEFGRQWLALCEAVGFVGLEHITAWKTEPGPVQSGIFENKDLTIDRVSFFRRLAINRAMAAEHWTMIDGETQAEYLTAATGELWQAYETGQTPPDQITEPELPAVRTVDSLRQYEQDLREYKRLAAVTGTGNKPPTERRILDYAQMAAWKDNGAESFDVDSAILNEDVWIVQKPGGVMKKQ